MILSWLDANARVAILLIPLLAFAEACVGIGLLVSGVFLLLVATVIFTNELAGIETIALLAMLGGFAGDQTGFYVGRWIGPRFHHTGVANRYRGSIDKAELMIRKHGAAAIFIGRFIPAIRSLIPAMLGLSGFSRRRYVLMDALACALWSLALAAIVLGLQFGF